MRLGPRVGAVYGQHGRRTDDEYGRVRRGVCDGGVKGAVSSLWAPGGVVGMDWGGPPQQHRCLRCVLIVAILIVLFGVVWWWFGACVVLV